VENGSMEDQFQITKELAEGRCPRLASEASWPGVFVRPFEEPRSGTVRYHKCSVSGNLLSQGAHEISRFYTSLRFLVLVLQFSNPSTTG
jgi:hypothetical protein